MSKHSGRPEDIAPPSTRHYRNRLFQLLLFFAISAFAFLTFLVETRPSLALDLQVTLAIQSIDSPLFAGLMSLISWPGFLPQSILIVVLIAFTLHIYGLRWEALTSLLAAAASGVSNELAKNLIQRPRPSGDLVNVFEIAAALNLFSVINVPGVLRCF